MRGPRSFSEESASRRSERTTAEGRAAGTRSPSEGQAASEARECPAPSPSPGSFSRQERGGVGGVRAGGTRGLHSLSLAQPPSRCRRSIPAPAEGAPGGEASAAGGAPHGSEAHAGCGGRCHVHPGGEGGSLSPCETAPP